MKAGLILLLGLLTGSYQQLGPYENNWLSHLPVDGYYDSAEPRQEPVGPLSYDEEEGNRVFVQPSSVYKSEQQLPIRPGNSYRYSSYRSSNPGRFWVVDYDTYRNAIPQFRANRPSYFLPLDYEERDVADQENTMSLAGEELELQIQSRGRPVPVPPHQQRFFFGFNPYQIYVPKNFTTTKMFHFGKTYAVIVTSTVNVTSVSSCVPAADLVENASVCKRRRRGIEHSLSLDELDIVSPSAVEKIEATLVNPQTDYEERNARLNHLLTSSKDEMVLENEDNRDKRSFLYAHTTTLTSFSFSTVTIPKELTLVANPTKLQCLPECLGICPTQ